jgi:hypothetical protein
VRFLTPSRAVLALLFAVILSGLVPFVAAQDDGSDVSLGDFARSVRKKSAPSEVVIDNDNLPKVMESAESRHAAGALGVFSLDPGGQKLPAPSPDVTCSLSFTGKTPFTDPQVLDDLPREELAKLDGPAILDGDSLQVSMHNGTLWELREVLIGLTIVKHSAGEASSFGQARIVPAIAGAPQAEDSFQKQPDVTLVLHVKGAAAPLTTAVFRTSLNFALFPDQEWHWAILKAKGIPPLIPQDTISESAPRELAPANIPADQPLVIAPSLSSPPSTSAPAKIPPQ